jgi:hypothetical protein
VWMIVAGIDAPRDVALDDGAKCCAGMEMYAHA